MFTQTFIYTSDGSPKTFHCKFSPVCVFVVPFGARVPTIYHDGSWANRAVPLGAGESFPDGIRIFGQDVVIGNAATVNTSGERFAMIAMSPENGDMELASWCGNGASQSLKLNGATKTPIVAMSKRDNALPLIIKSGLSAAYASDGTAITDCMALSAGSVSLTSESAVNEWVPSTGVGEGISGPVFYSGSVVTGVYTGNGSARTIPLGCVAATLLIWRVGGVNSAVRILLRGFGVAKTCDAVAAAASDASLDDGFLTLNTSFNSAGVQYCYVAIPMREPAVGGTTLSSVVAQGRKMWRTVGRGVTGYVDFGTGLNVSGEKTITWFGAAFGDAQGGDEFDGVMLMRASGAHGNTAGTASWGLVSVSRIHGGSALKWSGPHMVGIINDRIYYNTPIDVSCWRTGVLTPLGIHAHSLVIRADGSCEYWRDGVLLKQRRVPTDTFNSYSGHRVTMGARWTGSTYSNNGRLGFIESHFCGAALSDDQVRAEHARLLSGSTDAPALTGCIARWRAEDISGATLPDLVGSNHGTITGGSVVTI